MPNDGADFGRTRPCYGKAFTMARDGADDADIAECAMRGVELDIRRDAAIALLRCHVEEWRSFSAPHRNNSFALAA